MTNRPLISIALVSGFLCTACVQQTSQDEVASVEVSAAAEGPAVVLDAPFTTVKPGAGVIFTHTVQTEEASRRGVVDLSVEEYYDSGTLTLEASGDEGLSVFGASRTAQVDMASGAVHDWSISYEAEADGIYYINVQATAEPDSSPLSRRAYSVRLEIGDFVPGAEKGRTGNIETSANGDLIIVMEAEETIE